MSIVPLLATSLNVRNEEPNIALAEKIIATNNSAGVEELVELLQSKKKDIQNDCIKVLYEIGYRSPQRIAKYYKAFLPLLKSKNNRMQWGAMTALGSIASIKHKELFTEIDNIIDAADNGSVITRDHAVNILITLCGKKEYSNKAFPLLIQQLRASPANQLPSYAEKSMPLINASNKAIFISTLTAKLSSIETPTKKARVEKVIRKISST